MTVIISGTDGVSDVDGTAGTPAIRGTDTNTGIFFPAADNIGFATNGVIRGRWTTDGLCFGSDTAAANALDDYEEGTWTPTVAGTSSTSGQTYATQTGNYTKIGRLVVASFSLTLLNKGTITGDSLIAGLPFTIANFAGAGAGTISFFNNLTGTVSGMFLNANQNQTSAFLNHIAGTGATNIINTTDIIGTDSRFDGVFTYQAA